MLLLQSVDSTPGGEHSIDSAWHRFPMPRGKKKGGPTSLMFLSYNTNPLNVQYLNTLCFLLPHPSSHSQDLVGKGNQYKYDTTCCAVNNEILTLTQESLGFYQHP